MDWDEGADNKLSVLWNEGHATSEIGRRMGVSKNSIISRAHRIGLPGRQSPIFAHDPSKPPRQPKPRPVKKYNTTIPELPSEKAMPDAFKPVFAAPVATPPLPIAPSWTRSKPCQWPIGEPGTKTFRFCDDISVPGRPYCPEHCRRAYQPLREMRDAAD